MSPPPIDPQLVNTFKKEVCDRLRSEMPSIPVKGDSRERILAYWFEVVPWFEKKYAEARRFAGAAFGRLLGRSGPEVAFSPPDIVKVDEIARIGPDQLLDRVGRAIDLITARLATCVADELLAPLQRQGGIGEIRDYGDACRVHLPPVAPRSAVDADLMDVALCTMWRFPWSDDRLLRVPSWIGSQLLEGRCVRLVEHGGRPLARVPFRLALLRVGPYVLVTAPRLDRIASNPERAGSFVGTGATRPSLRTIALSVAPILLAGLASAVYFAPVWSALIAVVATLALSLILIQGDSNANSRTTP